MLPFLASALAVLCLFAEDSYQPTPPPSKLISLWRGFVSPLPQVKSGISTAAERFRADHDVRGYLPAKRLASIVCESISSRSIPIASIVRVDFPKESS